MKAKTVLKCHFGMINSFFVYYYVKMSIKFYIFAHKIIYNDA